MNPCWGYSCVGRFCQDQSIEARGASERGSRCLYPWGKASIYSRPHQYVSPLCRRCAAISYLSLVSWGDGQFLSTLGNCFLDIVKCSSVCCAECRSSENLMECFSLRLQMIKSLLWWLNNTAETPQRSNEMSQVSARCFQANLKHSTLLAHYSLSPRKKRAVRGLPTSHQWQINPVTATDLLNLDGCSRVFRFRGGFIVSLGRWHLLWNT